MKAIKPISINNTGVFTRSTIGGCFTQAGVYVQLGVNVPRVSFEPTPVLLNEGAATNYLFPSEDQSLFFTSLGTKTVTPAYDISNGISLDLVKDTDVANFTRVYKDVTIVDDSNLWVTSVFLKQFGSDNGFAAQLIFFTAAGVMQTSIMFTVDFGAKTATTTGGGTATGTCQLFEISPGFFRLKLTIKNNSTGASKLRIVYWPSEANGALVSDTGGVIVGGWQVEISVMTSYIKTTTAMGYRGAETNGLMMINSLPETDYVDWNNTTAYILNQTIQYNHKAYQCLIANTALQPDLNSLTAIPSWLQIGVTNTWKMFDDYYFSQSVAPTPLTGYSKLAVFINFGTTIDSIGFLNMSNVSSITIGVGVWSYTQLLNTVNKSDAVFLDLPAPFSTGIVSILLVGTAGMKCGKIVGGTALFIGETGYGTSVDIMDYSTRTVDNWGNTVINIKAYTKRISAKLMIDNTKVDAVYNYLAVNRSLPLVWVGDDNFFTSLIVYGYYRDFNITIDRAIESSCTLNIEGLT